MPQQNRYAAELRRTGTRIIYYRDGCMVARCHGICTEWLGGSSRRVPVAWAGQPLLQSTVMLVFGDAAKVTYYSNVPLMFRHADGLIRGWACVPTMV